MCTTSKTSTAKRSRWPREGFVTVYLSTFWCSEAGFFAPPSSVVVLDIDRTFHPSLPELVACWWRRSFGRTFIKNGACTDGTRYARRRQTTKSAWRSTRWLTYAFLAFESQTAHAPPVLPPETYSPTQRLWKRYHELVCAHHQYRTSLFEFREPVLCWCWWMLASGWS